MMKGKRILCALLALCLALGVMPGCMAAATGTDVRAAGKFDYVIDAAGARVTRYTGAARRAEIPATLGGAPVVAIGEKAFAKVQNLKRLTVPDTVISIAADAFAAKRALTLVGTPGAYVETFVRDYAGKARLTFESRLALRKLELGEKLTLAAGETRQLKPILTPANAAPVFLTYVSSDPSVAYVGEDGVAVALKAGKARIRAVNTNGVSDKLTIVVTGEVEPPEPYAGLQDENFFRSGKTLDKTIAYLASRYALAADVKGAMERTLAADRWKLLKMVNYNDPAKGDYVAYSIASRPVVAGDKKATLYCLTLRGTQDLQEWLSNLYIGTSGTHAGFSKACDAVYADIAKVLKAEKGACKLLLVGHSRGSAVGNLLAKRLLADGLVKPDDLFAYLFAPPAVAVQADASLPIHNFINEDDVVPRIPLAAWGYQVNGERNLLARGTSMFDKATGRFKMMTGGDYMPVPRSWWDALLAGIQKICPDTAKYDKVYDLLIHKYRDRIGMIVKYASNRQYTRVLREIIALIKDIAANNSTYLRSAGIDPALLADFAENPPLPEGGILDPVVAHEMPIYVAWMMAAGEG